MLHLLEGPELGRTTERYGDREKDQDANTLPEKLMLKGQALYRCATTTAQD